MNVDTELKQKLDTLDSEIEIEVLIGLEEGEDPQLIESFCGPDGTVMKNPGFDIYRVKATVNAVRQLIESEKQWVDFIERTETIPEPS